MRTQLASLGQDSMYLIIKLFVDFDLGTPLYRQTHKQKQRPRMKWPATCFILVGKHYICPIKNVVSLLFIWSKTMCFYWLRSHMIIYGRILFRERDLGTNMYCSNILSANCCCLFVNKRMSTKPAGGSLPQNPHLNIYISYMVLFLSLRLYILSTNFRKMEESIVSKTNSLIYIDIYNTLARYYHRHSWARLPMHIDTPIKSIQMYCVTL